MSVLAAVKQKPLLFGALAAFGLFALWKWVLPTLRKNATLARVSLETAPSNTLNAGSTGSILTAAEKARLAGF